MILKNIIMQLFKIYATTLRVTRLNKYVYTANTVLSVYYKSVAFRQILLN